MPAFYALRDTKTPVVAAFIAFVTNAVLGYVLGLYFSLHQFGLALASSISAAVNFLLLIYILNKRTKNLVSYGSVDFIMKTVAFSVIMGFVAWKASQYVNWTDNPTHLNALFLLLIILLSLAIYFGLSKMFNLRELNDLKGIIRRK